MFGEYRRAAGESGGSGKVENFLAIVGEQVDILPLSLSLSLSLSNAQRCPVCLTEYRHEDIVRILPYCGHFFHMTCIDIWLLQHSTCPVCRISLRECPDKKRMMQPLFSSAIRSPYAMQSFDTHACNCLLAGHGRTHDSRAMGSVRESFCAPEGPEAARGENIYPRTEGNQTGTASLQNKGKITDTNPFQSTQVWSASYTGSPLTESNQIVNDSGNKHVESTSNI
uniref:RING-type domain-containing protein n=1 Tax=Manihot esculenta TaxID=3983 RepID=A0A2C9V3L6_MANES